MQSNIIQRDKLNTIVQDFLNNSAVQTRFEATRQARTQQLPELQDLMHQFINKQLNLNEFRDRLQNLITRDGDPWDLIKPHIRMEINKLRKHHDEHHPYAEDELRSVVSGLNSNNLGASIERFYTFIQNERTRLRREGKESNKAMSPASTTLMLSLFNCWLHPDEPPILYTRTTCYGIYLLARENLIPGLPDLQEAYDSKDKTLRIRTERDYLAVQQAIKELKDSVRFFQDSPERILYFLYWYPYRNSIDPHGQPSEIPQLTKETDLTTALSASPGSRAIREDRSIYNASSPRADEEDFIPDAPLEAVPEPQLSYNIKEIQKHHLLSEEVIRRIYHALLAGHVILTGPPGTGKTEIARIIPSMLWRSQVIEGKEEIDAAEMPQDNYDYDTRTAYTTRLVTATDEWSVRTLIGGLAPRNENGALTYMIQYGFLTTTIWKNWSVDMHRPEEWEQLKRIPVKVQGAGNANECPQYRGQWLIIDEFNRAPIDLALGEALTALGGNARLRVPIDNGSAELPIPQDFRIIGTLNSFDRSYLNQISEALKRRFSFIEILPPTRVQRAAEQGIVLYKAFKRISHLSNTISVQEDAIYWQGTIAIEADSSGTYAITWLNEQAALREAFKAAWHLFEVIRIYRQLGTAQAISLVRHLLITGILQDYETREDWIAALDVALCDTLADQLQVLLPDETETLLLYLTTERDSFERAYNGLLSHLASMPHRLYGQLLALGSVNDDHGRTLLLDEEIEQIAAQEQPAISKNTLTALFHLEQPLYRLPQFTRRLRSFKAERGL